MVNQPPSRQDIFNAAADLPDAAEREAYLDRACAGNEDLRAEIDDLLRHDADVGSFLQSRAPEFAATIAERLSTEAPGTVIGPYKLVEQIGEGGFGVVFLAEQTEPVRRKVALKVLKPGMDTRQVIARFEAERQALALMDHPNIAKVFDGGATDAGRPYFAMELVHGIPITEHCDRNNLPVRERLELFVTVCRAVQHAHQKGIIHRDIKPSNVLVTLQDDKPVVKVIDFGVAKATSGQLTDRTLCTGLAQMIGTPLYMSPEAAFSGLDIDTRSDIYSLGVLLYELLTGTTPFDKQRLKAAAIGEIQRIIREEDPPRPSTRLSDLGRNGSVGSAHHHARSAGVGPQADGHSPCCSSLASISAVRKLEPHRLSQLLRGELDWIVMKALEKDRTRRYATALGLASDVENYLSNEPVEACPPSMGYRFRKFASRNRSALVAASMILAALVGGVVVSTWQAVRARDAERLTEARWRAEQHARQEAEVARQEAVTQRDRAVENFRTARSAVDQLLTRVAEERIVETPHMDVVRKELLEEALKFYLEFVKQDGQDLEIRREAAYAWGRVGHILQHLGQLERSQQGYRESIRRFDELAAKERLTPDDRLALANLLTNYVWSGISEFEAIDCLNRALGIICQLIEDAPDSTELKHALANSYLVLGARLNANPVHAIKAEQALRQALLLIHEVDAPFTLAGIHRTLGTALWKQSKPGVEQAYQEAVRISRQLVDQAPAKELNLLRLAGESTNLLGQYLHECQRYDDAVRTFQESLTYWKEVARLHPEVPYYRQQLGRCHRDLGLALFRQARFAEAEAEFREQIRLEPNYVAGHYDLGLALLYQNQPVAAEAELRRALELDPDNPWTRRYLERVLAEQLLVRALPAAEKRDWHTVAAELGAGFKLAPPDHALAWFSLAVARVLAGDLAGYQELIRRIPEQLRGREEFYVISACLLRADGTVNSTELLGNARRAYEAQRHHMTACNLGVAYYRAGDFERARHHIEEAQTTDECFLYWPALAMTHHRLGGAEAAGEWLDKAEAVFRSYTEGNVERPTCADFRWWQDWAYFEALLLEARELIEGMDNQ